jgi:CheY-like chemotaxis protein
MKACSSQRALVVDDDAGCRHFYTMLITECFPTVVVDHAPNGEEAVALFKENHYRAIVMDVHMPVQNGVVAAKAIGEHCSREDWEMPAIVLLSHYVPPQWLEGFVNKESLIQLLEKPVKSEDLISALRPKLTLK